MDKIKQKSPEIIQRISSHYVIRIFVVKTYSKKFMVISYLPYKLFFDDFIRLRSCFYDVNSGWKFRNISFIDAFFNL